MSRIRRALDDFAATPPCPRPLLTVALALYVVACLGYAAAGIVAVLS